MGDKEQEEKKKNGKRINLPCQITVRLDKHSFEFIEEIGVKRGQTGKCSSEGYFE
jgi:hypothetical protein